MGWAVVCVIVRPSERRVRERERERETKCASGGKPLSAGIMGNTYSSQFSFRSLRGYGAGELSIVKALKTDGFISGKKSREMGEM